MPGNTAPHPPLCILRLWRSSPKPTQESDRSRLTIQLPFNYPRGSLLARSKQGQVPKVCHSLWCHLVQILYWPWWQVSAHQSSPATLLLGRKQWVNWCQLMPLSWAAPVVLLSRTCSRTIFASFVAYASLYKRYSCRYGHTFHLWKARSKNIHEWSLIATI